MRAVILTALLFIVALILEYFNYIYFHTFIESATIIISFIIFTQCFRGKFYSSFFTIVGSGYLSVGAFDLMHTLSYQGMGLLNGGANAATQFWLLARLTEALTYMLAIIFSGRQVNYIITLGLSVVLTVLGIFSVYTGFFPAAYIRGVGLTPFKINAEYVVIVLLFFSLVNIYRLRDNFDYKDSLLLSLALGLTIISEYLFTLYDNVYGIVNATGHILKFISFMLVGVVFIPSLKSFLKGKKN